MRLRIEWGGGTATKWQGTIKTNEGTLRFLGPNGVEADHHRGTSQQEKHIVIDQPSARVYDGFDVVLDAPRSAVLTIELSGEKNKNQPPVITIPLRDLIDEKFEKKIDDRNNRLIVDRAPGDRLRVTFDRDSLVFSPGEFFAFDIVPHLLSIDKDVKPKFSVTLSQERSDNPLASWNVEYQAADRDMDQRTIPFKIQLPRLEGTYLIRIVAEKTGWKENIPFTEKIIAHRAISLVVIDKERPIQNARLAAEPKEIALMDPANPNWWQRIRNLPQVDKLPGIPKGPWNNKKVAIWRHPKLGDCSRLLPGGWSAFPLAIDELGSPHVVEIEYPSDLTQKLGISIVEPNAAGQLNTIGLDSGVAIEIGSKKPDAKWRRQRLIFWARTSSPVLLLTNLHSKQPAIYGKIRLIEMPTPLPRAVSMDERIDGRMLGGFFDQPLLPEAFGTTEFKDSKTGRSLDDWTTFYHSAHRLVGYLNHLEYSGVMLAAYSSGSGIFPSATLQPSARFDTGLFFSDGRDPVRKDVLELLFRLFDREQLTLIPMVEFSSPLPGLEKRLRAGGKSAEGILLLNWDGKPRTNPDPSRGNPDAYYNPLHPAVQGEVIAAVREIASRYGKHPSFGGLSLSLSGTGFMVFPGIDWGLDDATFAVFKKDEQIILGDVGQNRFAVRSNAVLGQHRKKWLRWRAAKLAEFHLKLQQAIVDVNPRGKLFLAGAKMFDGPHAKKILYPNLLNPVNVQQLMAECGIATVNYQGKKYRSTVLLRPYRIAPATTLAENGPAVLLNESTELDTALRKLATSGTQFYHHPQWTHLPSFDEKKPFGIAGGNTWLVSQVGPAAESNRRRFAHALAKSDSRMMFDGGWMMLRGQLESMHDFAEVYRKLPDVPFQEIAQPSAPVTVRTYTDRENTLAYLVNDSPWEVQLTLELGAPRDCQIESLSSTRKAEPVQIRQGHRFWAVKLKPYDLFAVKFSQPNVRLRNPRVEIDPAVVNRLNERIKELGDRTRKLGRPPDFQAVANSDFEQKATGRRIPGWLTTKREGVTIRTDNRNAYRGVNSVSIRSEGPIGSLVSDWFEASPTGRLAILVALRTENTQNQPPLRVAIETEGKGVKLHRFMRVGAKPADNEIKPSWERYIFPFEQLPTARGTRMRIRFDLMGAGAVAVDKVRLFDLNFTRRERGILSSRIALAKNQLDDGRLDECDHLLDQLWMRFLLENVPQDGVLQARSEDGKDIK